MNRYDILQINKFQFIELTATRNHASFCVLPTLMRRLLTQAIGLAYQIAVGVYHPPKAVFPAALMIYKAHALIYLRKCDIIANRKAVVK